MQKWLCGYVVTVLIVGVIVVVENVWDLNKSDWASWVQAIGSIAAIGGAFVIATKQASAQHLSALALEEESLRRRWLSVKALLDSIYQQCLDVEQEFAGDGDFGPLAFVGNYDKGAFSEAIERLNNIPFFDLDSDRLVTAVIGIKEEAARLRMCIDEGRLRRLGAKTDLDARDHALKGVACDTLFFIKKHYADAVFATGGVPITDARPSFWRYMAK